MSRLPAPSKLARPGGLIRPSMPPPNSRPNPPVEASAKKRPMPRGPPPNQANFHVQRTQDDAKSNASVQSAMSEVAHDLVVGNRVLVGGDRPGVIAFLGTTLFSRGEWAGVILDEPLGKNNGVVQGVQYFQCEPNHGVFARPQNLVLEPPKQLPKQAAKPPDKARKFQVGDAVLVSGTKPGVIAFLGPTQFAKGEWAGVVMEKPEGKNDGTVQGVVYFQCPPQHGLFARLHNLKLIQPAVNTAPAAPAVMNTPSQPPATPTTNVIPPSSNESTAATNLQEKLKELQVYNACMHVGVHPYTYMYACTCVYTCLHACINIMYLYTCCTLYIDTCMHDTYIYTHTMHAYIRVYIHTYIHGTYIFTYVHTYAQTYVYIHRHTYRMHSCRILTHEHSWMH